MLMQPNGIRGKLASPRKHASLRAYDHARPALVTALALALSCAGAVTAEAQHIRDDFYVTNGTVLATALSGNTLYIGGQFSRVGPATGSGVPVDAISGAPLAGFPKVAGYVSAVVPDGSGGWYIGGGFTAVGGVPRNGIAHILADNSVSPWNPNVQGSVSALALSGGLVYVGGSFTNVGGETRNSIAALDVASGHATGWNPDASTGDPYAPPSVLALTVSGSTVYVGGFFTSIGGQPRNNIAALHTNDGLATAWNPSSDNEVAALAVSGSTVYVGGHFFNIGGQARLRIAALDATTGLATAWNPNAGDRVLALVVSGNTVYAGGYFSGIGGATRNGIAALDATSGLATDWTPNATGTAFALALNGGTVYAAGALTLDGKTLRGIVALDAGTGLATSWDPKPDGFVNAVATNGSTVYFGGSFNTMGAQIRNNIAALDVTTGRVTDWNPNARVRVNALAVSGSTVYVAGCFDRIGGQMRNGLAALDATTGLANSWNPANDPMSGGGFCFRGTLVASEPIIYASGGFYNLGGQVRHGLAALDATSGLATDWNPDPNLPVENNPVLAIAVSGSTVYVGGLFTSIGGQARSGIAALDAASGLATDWNPHATGLDGVNPAVSALVVNEGLVYAGGTFAGIGGQARSSIAALDATTGLATAWDPQATPYSQVDALAVHGSTVYAGGTFTKIGGQPRSLIAALDATTGHATSWDAHVNGYQVNSLATDGPTVYVGGDFVSMGNLPQSSLAAIGASGVPLDCSHAIALPSQISARGHQLVPVRITGVNDADGDPVTITVTRVTQDEPVDGRDDDGEDAANGSGLGTVSVLANHGDPGNVPDEHGPCPDAMLDQTGGVSVRAERSGQGNGRVYTIWFTATDGRGGSCDGSVQVCVPHDEHHLACIDDGQKFNSLGSCPGDHVRKRDRAVAAVTLTTSARIGNLTTLEYALPEASDVTIAVFDIAGRRVATLERGRQSAGTHDLNWDVSGVLRGLYFCRIQAGPATLTRPVLIMK